MGKFIKRVVLSLKDWRPSRLALAFCVWAPFAHSSAAGDAAAPDSGGAPPAGSALQEVLVESQRTTADVARKAQEEAPNLINIQTYSEIRKLPDITTAEAVRRIPGISLETDEGEGRYVNIRGLDADLNSTTFGGLRLPPTNNASPFGGYRAVTLDSIPIGLVGAITVTKSNIPSMDAEALGGTIEITPKTAPTNGAPFIEGDVGGGYETLRRKPLIIFALSGGGRFGGRGAPAGTSTEAYSDHPFSIVATVTYRENWRGIDDVEPAYFNDSAHPYHAFNNLQQRDYELNRKRHGYGLDFGYQPDSNNQWYLRAFEAGYSERYWRQFLNLNPDGLTTTGPNGEIFDSLTGAGYSGQSPSIQMALRDERESSKDQVAVLGGENNLGGNTLDYRLGYTKGSWNKPYDYNSFFNYSPSTANTTIAYSPNGLGHTPVYTITGADYLNGANYTLGSFANSSAYNFDKEKSAAVDLKIPVNWGGLEAESIQIGGSARLRNKLTTNQPYTYPTLPPIVLGDIAVTGPESYYKDQYMNPPDIPPGYLQGELGSGVITGIERGQYLQQYLDAKEDVYAGYAQYQVTVGRLGIIGGVRVEETHSSGNAYNVLANSGTPVLDASGNPIATPVNTSHRYTDVLPGIQLRYELQPDLISRFAWSSTLARPGFNQNNPSQTVDLGSSQVTVGNPNLRAATSTNLDLSRYKGLHIIVTGEEGLDERWKNTPVITIQRIQVLD